MAKLIWTDAALDCLRGIRDYIFNHNPTAAQRVAEGIYHNTELLEKFPELGYVHRRTEDGEVRILLYGHYRIMYTFQDDRVTILGVYHAAMDINGSTE